MKEYIPIFMHAAQRGLPNIVFHDLLPVRESLRTIKLTSPVTFDDKCVQPACVPNKEIDADDIDFGNCRFVGYGATSDSAGKAFLCSTYFTLLQ